MSDCAPLPSLDLTMPGIWPLERRSRSAIPRNFQVYGNEACGRPVSWQLGCQTAQRWSCEAVFASPSGKREKRSSIGLDRRYDLFKRSALFSVTS